MLEMIKKIFIGLLTDIISVSNLTKCLLLRNQKYMNQPSFGNSHPNK